MDYSPPGSFVCGISQARILERIARPSFRLNHWKRLKKKKKKLRKINKNKNKNKQKGNNGNTETLYFWRGGGFPKITVVGDCSHEIKRCFLLGKKAVTNLDSILKSRDITFLTKVPIVKAIVFPVVMYGCESWTVKKAEHQRIDAFELWCWRRLLRVPWTARRSNQSILKEISPGVFFGRTDA